MNVCMCAELAMHVCMCAEPPIAKDMNKQVGMNVCRAS